MRALCTAKLCRPIVERLAVEGQGVLVVCTIVGSGASALPPGI
jgi:hypothetical protein